MVGEKKTSFSRRGIKNSLPKVSQPSDSAKFYWGWMSVFRCIKPSKKRSLAVGQPTLKYGLIALVSVKLMDGSMSI